VADTSLAIAFSEEEWRTFFIGKFHQNISISLSEAFSEIFKYCAKLGLLLEPQQAVESVSYKDVNDLSDTTGLVYIRFPSIFCGHNGQSRSFTLPQMLNAYYVENKHSMSAKDSSHCKQMLRLCREFENICSILKLGRNVNAHMQTEILDSGFTLQICSSIIRLYEIFDYKRVSSANIDLIRTKAISIISEGFRGKSSDRLSSKKSTNFSENPEKVYETWKEVGQTNKEVRPTTISEDADQIEIPIDIDIQSSELQRQKLHKIKIEIYRFIESQSLDIEKRMTLLYGSNLSDILAFKPKSLDQLRSVLSVEILISRNSITTETQIEKFGQQIVDVFT